MTIPMVLKEVVSKRKAHGPEPAVSLQLGKDVLSDGITLLGSPIYSVH